MTKETICEIPPFSTIEATRGWGTREGEGDLHFYNDERLYFYDDSSFKIGEIKLVLINSDITENEFTKLFESITDWPALAERETKRIAFKEHEYDGYEKRYYDILDLSHLDRFKKLEILEFSSITEHGVVDWTPVSNCAQLREIWFIEEHGTFRHNLPEVYSSILELSDSPPLSNVDLVYSLKKRNFVCYYQHRKDRIHEKWSDIFLNWNRGFLYIPEEYWFYAQRLLLMSLRLEELAGYIGNPLKILANVSPDMVFEQAREVIFNDMIDLLAEQIEHTSRSLLLDVDRMKESKAAKLIPAILKARKKEIRDLVIPIVNGKALLELLSLTAYGFQIMHERGMTFSATLTEYQELEEVVREIGFEIESAETDTDVRFVLSEELKGLRTFVGHELGRRRHIKSRS